MKGTEFYKYSMQIMGCSIFLIPEKQYSDKKKFSSHCCLKEYMTYNGPMVAQTMVQPFGDSEKSSIFSS